ncbi:MAG: DNA recombination protein RmuC [Actinomycetota bacterium]|jgi:DNA recombination protein RmuC|nr:DNA recombination protein RmuC [Actinomycetota bacterium]
MNGAIFLIIGLAIGLAIGFLFASLRVNAEKGKVAILNTQLEELRREEARLTTLNEQLRAVTTGMTQLTTQAQEAEVKRARAESEMRSQIETMRLGNENLLRETTKLAGALSNSQTRGKYGEAQLETLLENAGLLENEHFFKQDYRTTGTEISKPDIKISVPGGSEIFIDSKFPFDRFLEAVVEKDPIKRKELMQQHAKDLLGHVNALAKRGYQEKGNSPDYVVLFAPFESILSEALDVEPQLLHKAFEKNVTIATPTTMMALLRTVAYVFSRSDLAKNAQEITDLAGELLKRIGKVHSKIETLGDRIKSTERAFNDLIKSAEENVLKPARKMVKLGAPSSSKLKAIEDVDDEVRLIAPKELEAPDLAAEDIDLDDSDESDSDDK